MANRQITYGIGFSVDRAGLDQLKKELQQLSNLSVFNQEKMGLKLPNKELTEIRESAKQVEAALTQAFNVNLGTINIAKFNQALAASGTSISQVSAKLNSAGITGQTAISKMSLSLMTTNLQLKQSNTLLNQMGTTLANTIKWGISSSVMNSFVGSVQQAYGYVKNLDGSLNDIRIVTGKSADEMANFAEKANTAAKALGKSTTDYTNASLIFYQQGLSDQEVEARADVTLKAANVTGQSTSEVSEQLTAIWNGYKVSSEEAELYIDKVAAVAATTASDLEELATGMSKVASAADLMGVDIDQLNAQLATIVSVTRQAPESVGTALKTIYARMSDIQAGLDEETTLDTYTKGMAKMGFNVLDANNQLRDMGEVIEEIGGKWTSLTREQQISLAQVMAGTRQYNNLLSLFDNWDMYTKALETSSQAAGTLQKQQDRYMESTAAHLQQLSTQTEDLWDSMLDSGTINFFADLGTGIAKTGTILMDAMGGGKNAIFLLGAVASKILNNQIVKGFMDVSLNAARAEENIRQVKNQFESIRVAQQLSPDSQAIANASANLEAIRPMYSIMSTEDINTANQLVYNQGELAIQKEAYEKAAEGAQKYFNQIQALKSLDAKKILEVSPESEDFQTVNTELEKIRQNLEKVNKTSITVNIQDDSLESIKNDVISLATSIGATDEEVKNLEGAFSKFKSPSEGSSKEAELEKLQAIITDIVGDATQAEAVLNKVMEGSGGNYSKISTELTQADQALQSFMNSWQKANQVAKVNQIAGAVSQTVFGIQSLLNVTKILENESISTGEKILQITGAVAMSFPTLLTSFEKLSQMFITSSLGANAFAVSMGKGTKETILSIITNEARQAATKKLNKEMQEQLLAIALDTKLTQKQRQEKMKNLVIQALETSGLEKDTIETEANIVVTEILTKAQEKLNKTLKASPWIMLATVIAAAGVALYAYSQSAEKAKKDLAKSNEEYAETVSKIESLNGELENAQARIEELENQDSLTLLEEEELVKLKAANEELKTQIELEKARRALAGEEVISDAIDFVNKDKTLEDPFSDFLNSNSLVLMFQDKGLEGLSPLEQYEKIKAVLEEKRDNSSDSDYYQNLLKDLEEQKGELVEEYSQYFENVGTQTFDLLYDKINKGIELTQSEKDTLSTLENAKAEEYELLGLMPSVTSRVAKNVFGSNEDYNTFKSLLAGKSSDGELTQEEFNDAVASAGGSVSDMETLLQGQRINFETFGEAVVTFDGNLYDLAETADKTSESLASLSALDVSSIQKLNFGDTIEEELYQSLIDAGIAADDFFVKLSDGSYQAKVGIGQLKNEVAGIFSSQTEESVNDFYYKSGILEQLKNGGITSREESGYADIRDGNIDAAKLQLDFARDMGHIDQDLYEEWLLAMEDGTLSEQSYKNLQNMVDHAIDEVGGTKAAIEKYTRIVEAAQMTAEASWAGQAESASSFLELDSMVASQQISEDAYKDYLDSTIFEELENLDIETDGFEELVKTTEETADVSEESAKRIVASTLKINKGVESLRENWEENFEILSNPNLEGSFEYITALASVRESLETTFGVPIDDSFITENLQDINALANGDADAIDRIGLSLAQLSLIDVGVNLNDEELQNDVDTVSSYLETLSFEDLEIGATIDDTQAINALNNLVGSSDETAKAVTEALAAAGYYPNITTKTTTQTVEMLETVSLGFYPNGEPIIRQIPSKVQTLVEVPVIESLTYRGRGNTQLSSANKKPLSSGKKKGGGGGSKSKPKVKEQKKDDFDRYHDINIEIEKLSREMEDLSEAQEKLTGPDLVDNLNEQLDILEKQKDVYEEKIQLLKMEQGELQRALAAEGARFNADGTIANYQQFLQSKLNELNKVISNYNKMSAAEQEKHEQEIEDAEEKYEEIKEQVERYDEIIGSEIPDLEDQIQEAINREIEIKVEKFNMQVELTLEVAEAEKQWDEFKNKIIEGLKEDDILGTALAGMDSLDTYYKDTGNGLIQVTQSHVNEVLRELQTIRDGGVSSIYGDNEAKAMEDLKTYSDELMSQLQEYEDAVQEITDAHLDLIDSAQESFDKQIEQYEYISGLIEHNMDVLTLLQGEDAYGDLVTYYEQQEANNNKLLDFERQQAEFWRQKMEQEEKGSEAWEKYYENWKSATEQLNDTVAASIETLIEKYENAVNKIFQDLNNSVTSGKGLEYISEEWELMGENADQFLDDINAMFAIEQLENKYLDAINNTDSLAVQERLNDLMDEQLDMLRSKEKLTEYDVERAEKLYEIALKQIALEEAQQNKSKLRLRRDSQGNYTYQYVSDEDQIADAQRELAEAQNSLYNFDKERYQDNLDQIYSTYNDFQEKLSELWADSTLTYEEKQAKELLLTQQYESLINGMVEENQSIRTNLQESAFADLANLYKIDISSFEKMTNEEKDILMKNLVPQWKSSVQEMADAFIGEDGFIGVIGGALDELHQTWIDFNKDLGEAQNASGIDFDVIIGGEDIVEQTQGIIENNDELIGAYNGQLQAMDEILTSLNKMSTYYQDVKQDAIEAATAAYEYWTIAKGGTLNENIFTPEIDKEQVIPLNEVDELISVPDMPINEDADIDSSDAWSSYLDELSNALVQGDFISNLENAELSAYNNLTPILSALENSLMSYMTGTMGNLTAAVAPTNTTIIEQAVHIEANFPNVSSSNEIEEAFNNLINIASQHAYNTNK